MYLIKKILNNNALLAIDKNDSDTEIIFLGKGVGFNHKIDNEYKEILNAKKFLSNDNRKIRENIDTIYIELAYEIMNDACLSFEKINYNIVYALADHIYYLIKRIDEKVVIENPFAKDIELLYPKEYEIAKKAKERIKEKIGIEINKSEISYITLHIYSALVETSLSESMKNAIIINETINKIKDLCEKEINNESLSYSRMLIHLKYLIIRLDKGERINVDMNEYVKENFKNSYEIAKQAINVMEDMTKLSINKLEVGYLGLHIERICNDIK